MGKLNFEFRISEFGFNIAMTFEKLEKLYHQPSFCHSERSRGISGNHFQVHTSPSEL
jgi:hypothetical protein